MNTAAAADGATDTAPQLGDDGTTEEAGNAAGQASDEASNQDQQEDDEAQRVALEELTVTGSLIRRSGMLTPTPVTVMQSSELSEMNPGNLVDSLSTVPQFIANLKPSDAISKADSAGAANLNMRGIGPKRTLVLLNGRRMVPSNRLGNVDINLFPEPLVERVEVVTGGASAAYGTNAVAGVSNFILNTDFTGVQGHAQGGITTYGDRENYEVSITGGMPVGDRMHVILSADRYEAKRVDNMNGRDWCTGVGTVTNPNWPEENPRLLVRENVVSTQYTNGGLIRAPGTSIDRLHFLSDGTPTPFVFGSPASPNTGTQTHSITDGGSGWDPTCDYDQSVESENYPQGTRSGSFIPPIHRASGFAYVDYDVTDNFTVFAQGLYGNNRSSSAGTLPWSWSIWAPTIFRENAYLPESIRETMEEEEIDSFQLHRWHTAADIGQDRFIMENNTYSLTGGFNAEISDGMFDEWQINGYWQSGWNHNHLDFDGFVNRQRLPLALDAVVDPATGSIVCNVTLQSDQFDDCVPINLFGAGNASKEAIEWVTSDMFVQANTRQHNAEISANGEIYEGWGAGAISGAVGASWREQSIKHRIGPDNMVNQPPLANDPANGIRGIPLAWLGTDDRLQFVDLDNYDGSFNVKEVFAETLVPLVSDQAFAQQLSLNLAARWADYSGSGGVWAWKAGLDWELSNELRFRGTYSRDIRAGSLEERFDRQGQAVFIDDPEFGRDSITTFQIRGGNPNVDPEKSDSFTVGAVYQPSFLDGLSISLDWYSIKIKGAIDLLGAQEIVDQCFDEGGDICDRVHRDAETNQLTLVENVFLNLNKIKASGADLEVTYNTQFELFGGGAESLNARFLGSWQNENSITNVNGVKTPRVGQIPGLTSSFPEYQWTANVSYTNGPFSLFVQERFIDGGVSDLDFVEGVDIEDNSISSRYYTDLNLTYRFEAINNGQWQAFLHVTNLFNQDPPIDPQGGAQGLIYDELGRRYTAGLRFQY